MSPLESSASAASASPPPADQASTAPVRALQQRSQDSRADAVAARRVITFNGERRDRRALVGRALGVGHGAKLWFAPVASLDLLTR